MIERSEHGADPRGPAGETAADGSWSVRPDPAAPPPAWPPPADPWAPPPPSAPPPGWAPVTAEGEGLPGEGDVSLGRLLAAGGSPDTRGSAWTWLLFAVLGFLAGQILAGVFAAVTAAISGDTASLTAIARLSEPPTWYIVSTLLGLWGGFFGSAWVATRARGTKSFRRDLGLRFRWVDLAGIPIGVGGQFLVALIYVPISQHVHNFNQRFDAPSQKLTGGSHGASFFLIAVFTVVGAPFFEELFFRGVLLRAFARLFGTVGRWVGPTLAVIVTGVIFGLAHAEGLQLLGLAVFGVILSAVSYRTGRLGMNMTAHASFNLVAVAASVVTPLGLVHGVLL